MTTDLTRHQRACWELNNSRRRCGGTRRSRCGGGRRLRRCRGSRRRYGGSRRRCGGSRRRCGASRRLRRCRRSRNGREVTRGESRGLVNHPRVGVIHVRVEVCPARANRVIGDAQVDRLSHVQRADLDLRLIDHPHEPAIWFSEQGDRGNVVCHVGRHRVRYTFRCSIRYDVRGDEAHHRCALGVSAEHHLGVGTGRRRGPDMGARVSNAVEGGGEVGGGRVVNRVYADRLCTGACAQRVHKCLPGWPDTGVLGGAAGEYHLDVGARLRERGRNGCAQRHPTCNRRRTNEHSDTACPHGVMLTYRVDGGDPNANLR